MYSPFMPTPILSTEPAPAGPSIHFSADNDQDAKRVCAVLFALGFAPRRVVREDSPAARAGLDVALERCAKRYRWTVQETKIAGGIARGVEDFAECFDLDTVQTLIGRQSLKWLTHSLCVKTGVKTLEALLVCVLGQLDAIESPAPASAEPEPRLLLRAPA